MDCRTFLAVLILSVSASIISAQPPRIVGFQGTGTASHFYQAILDGNVKWRDAEKLATLQAHVDDGTILTGYLATITTWEEQQFLIREFGDNPRLWIGGRRLESGPDGALEWRWVTGPEGLEADGTGKLFWGSEPARPGLVFNNAFHDWIMPDNDGFGGAPDNDRKDEEFLIWNFRPDNSGRKEFGVHGRVGLWNNSSNEGRRDERPMGFIVEFGQ